MARRERPYELLSDQGTNFKGGERELEKTFSNLQPEIQTQLVGEKIRFGFNQAHLILEIVGKREIHSVKQVLQVALGAQAVSGEV